MESTINKKIDQPKCTEIDDIVFLIRFSNTLLT